MSKPVISTSTALCRLLNDMNTEALVPKLMCALGKTNNLAELKQIIETPVLGDLHVEPTGFKY